MHAPTRPSPLPHAPARQLKHTITALAAKGDLTFAALRGGAISECRRVHASGAYRGHTADVLQLLVLGDRLLSLGADGRLLAWRIGEYAAPEASIQLPRWAVWCAGRSARGCAVAGHAVAGPAGSRPTVKPARHVPHTFPSPLQRTRSGFVPTCMAHPDTYLNKVVVGAEDGRLQLWNFATASRLYEFAGWGSAVRCIAPSPALDVVGVGLADGCAGGGAAVQPCCRAAGWAWLGGRAWAGRRCGCGPAASALLLSRILHHASCNPALLHVSAHAHPTAPSKQPLLIPPPPHLATAGRVSDAGQSNAREFR